MPPLSQTCHLSQVLQAALNSNLSLSISALSYRECQDPVSQLASKCWEATVNRQSCHLKTPPTEWTCSTLSVARKWATCGTREGDTLPLHTHTLRHRPVLWHSGKWDWAWRAGGTYSLFSDRCWYKQFLQSDCKPKNIKHPLWEAALGTGSEFDVNETKSRCFSLRYGAK